MHLLYRVFPYLESAAALEPGGPFYIAPQSGGRLDNPHLYSVFYASYSAAGAIAEAFGRFPEWNRHILSTPSLPGGARGIAQFELEDRARVYDLDNPARLLALKLRPSEIVGRDYARTRSWAKSIFEARKWIGVRWWSYYDPKWASAGLWDIGQLTVNRVRKLDFNDPEMEEAARTIARRIIQR